MFVSIFKLLHINWVRISLWSRNAMHWCLFFFRPQSIRIEVTVEIRMCAHLSHVKLWGNCHVGGTMVTCLDFYGFARSDIVILILSIMTYCPKAWKNTHKHAIDFSLDARDKKNDNNNSDAKFRAKQHQKLSIDDLFFFSNFHCCYCCADATNRQPSLQI